jgi:hypothetical protein
MITSSLTFQITRNKYADAGYGIAGISIKGGKEVVVINNVEMYGPAYNAGLREEHIGWLIYSVNDIVSNQAKTILELLESTKNANYTFVIKIQPIFENNGNNDLMLKSCLNKPLPSKKQKTTGLKNNLTTGNLFNAMWELVIQKNPEYENIKDNNFRHAILACSTIKAQERLYQQYLNLKD